MTMDLPTVADVDLGGKCDDLTTDEVEQTEIAQARSVATTRFSEPLPVPLGFMPRGGG